MTHVFTLIHCKGCHELTTALTGAATTALATALCSALATALANALTTALTTALVTPVGLCCLWHAQLLSFSDAAHPGTA